MHARGRVSHVLLRVETAPGRLPQLYVLGGDDGGFKAVWVGEVANADGGLTVFVDANSGAVVRRLRLFQTQQSGAYVGHGKGVLGDDKKLSTIAYAGGFLLFDTLRPPEISTFALGGNLTRTIQFLNGWLSLSTSDYGFTTNNDWTDSAAVDAHAYASYTYDYYYKRFSRRGLDNADHRVWNIVHAVNRSDIFTAPAEAGDFYLNAFYDPASSVMVYGEGLPSGYYVRSSGQYFDYFSGAIDIVAHELTHGVTDYTSRLTYAGESGALNEAFSDIMGTSVEFAFQPVGNGPRMADYLCGEDIARAVVAGALNGNRSMANPSLYGQPDHYSKRLILPLDDAHDNGGVHYNSGIANQAFYLAIEGGTNRTSGITVQGVGAANRIQIERIFYRAFTQLLPSSATFAVARAATLRAAQDLYGLNSAPHNAVRDAWTAVGVN